MEEKINSVIKKNSMFLSILNDFVAVLLGKIQEGWEDGQRLLQEMNIDHLFTKNLKNDWRKLSTADARSSLFSKPESSSHSQSVIFYSK